MMLQYYLVNILIFCAILLLIVLIVGAIQLVLMAIDIRKMTDEVKNKVLAITSLFDIVSLVIGGLDIAKRKIPISHNLTAFAAGLKKALQVLFKS